MKNNFCKQIAKKHYKDPLFFWIKTDDSEILTSSTENFDVDWADNSIDEFFETEEV